MKVINIITSPRSGGAELLVQKLNNYNKLNILRALSIFHVNILES